MLAISSRRINSNNQGCIYLALVLSSSRVFKSWISSTGGSNVEECLCYTLNFTCFSTKQSYLSLFDTSDPDDLARDL